MHALPSSHRFSGTMGTGKSATLRATVSNVIDHGIRPIAYLPIVSDVGLRTERVEFADEDVAGALGAREFAGRLTRNLSSGERQRVRLAAAVSRSIRFAALDEPCRHLDPNHVVALNDVLAERTQQGMRLAVSDGRRLLDGGLFEQELGEEASDAPRCEVAPPPRGAALELTIPLPFLLSREQRSRAQRSIEIRRGALIVVRGPNGSGKTSLLEALSRAATSSRAKVGFSRQEPEHQVFSFTPRDEIEDIASLHPRAPWCAQPSPERSHANPLAPLITNLELQPWLSLTTPRLPLGALSLLGTAIALWMGHDLILLDEPSQGLDTRMARKLAAELVRCVRAGARIVVASHDPELVRVANEAWATEAGELTVETAP